MPPRGLVPHPGGYCSIKGVTTPPRGSLPDPGGYCPTQGVTAPPMGLLPHPGGHCPAHGLTAPPRGSLPHTWGYYPTQGITEVFKAAHEPRFRTFSPAFLAYLEAVFSHRKHHLHHVLRAQLNRTFVQDVAQSLEDS